jgi:hypothetical protein
MDQPRRRIGVTTAGGGLMTRSINADNSSNA